MSISSAMRRIWPRETVRVDRQRNLMLGRGYQKSLQYALNCGISPVTVYDVGAATGTPWLYSAFPDARHLLFEPLPAHVEVLRSKYADSDFEIHNTAIGSARGSAKLHIPVGSGSKTTWSSLLEISDEMNAYDRQRGVKSEMIAVDVPLAMLDDFAQDGRCVMKVDVEGTEMDVLRGASHVLKTCDLLILEMSIYPRMAGEARFADIIRHLDGLGFELFDIPAIFYPLSDCDLSFIDALFVPVADRRFGKWIKSSESSTL